MDNVSCATCPFFSDGDNACHHTSNVMDPSTGPEYWCNAHPLAPGQRDRIAEMAMQGLSSGGFVRSPEELPSDGIVRVSYLIADAMMAKRAKGKEPTDG